MLVNQVNHAQKEAAQVVTNPLKVRDDEVLNRLTNLFKDFTIFFDNNTVDDLIQKEFGKKYATLPVLVKERLYCK